MKRSVFIVVATMVLSLFLAGCNDDSGALPTCGANQVLTDGHCLDASIACKPGEVVKDGKCVLLKLDCLGQISPDGKCIKPWTKIDCVPGAVLQDGWCMAVDGDADGGDAAGGGLPPDTDGDGVPDSGDAFPNDPKEIADNDKDGIGDNADLDDDNDGVADGVDPDADDDGHEAIAYGGDDCDDTSAAVHPGASDLPDGDQPSVDFNCDGLADGDVARGFVVDAGAANANDANSGTSAQPLKTLQAAFGKVLASLGKPNERSLIYLVYYPKVGGPTPYSFGGESTTVPRGVHLYGGYLPLPPGAKKRDRVLTQTSHIRIVNGESVKIHMNAKQAASQLPDIQLDTLAIEIQTLGELYIVDALVTLRRVEVIKNGTMNAVRIVGTQGETAVTLEKPTTIMHLGGGDTVGLDVEAKGAAHVALTLNGAIIKSGKAVDLDKDGDIDTADVPTKPTIGLRAWATSPTATMDVTVVDSRIETGNGSRSLAVLLGDDGTMNKSGHVNQVVLERNQIRAGFAAGPVTDNGAVIIVNATAAILRNNFLIAGRILTNSTNLQPKESVGAKGVYLLQSPAHLVGNTIRDATYAVQVNAPNQKVALVNNLFSTWPGTGHAVLVVDKELTFAELSNNLFDAAATVLYQFVNKGVLESINSINGSAQMMINGLGNFASYQTFVNGGDNLVAKPAFSGDTYVLNPTSPALNKAKMLSAGDALSGESPEDVTVDIQSQQRGSTAWDIGAFEQVLLP